MAGLTARLEVGDQRGIRFRGIELIVDAGSMFTALPRTLLEELAVPVGRQANSRMAGGRTATVDVVWTMVRLERQTFPIRVTFADEGERSLLGVARLGEALLAVDLPGQRLIPVNADRL